MRKRPGPGRTRVNDPEAMRGRVLDAAAASFQMRGYHSTSTHDIVREAGITAGALHHHFRTKKDLGLAVIRERVGGAVEQTWIEPVLSARTATEGILTAFDQIASSLAKRRLVLGCPLNNLAIELSLVDPDFRQAVREIYDRWRGSIAQRLRADFEDIDAEALATFVVASYSGAIALAKAEQDPSSLKSCAQQLASTMRQWVRRPDRLSKRSA
jgi:AcrR family transcriptional regulator